VVATTSEPALGAIRLAWWRERLEALDTDGPRAGEPRLSAIARQLLGRGISGAELSKLEDAWLPLLEPFPWGGPQADGLRLRGRILFGTGARLLGSNAKDAEAAGALWSLVDGAEHCSDSASRDLLLAEARRVELPWKISGELRPLTVLAALAASDLKGGSGVRRAAAALSHRIGGTFLRS
jgi:phytoene synthase